MKITLPGAEPSPLLKRPNPAYAKGRMGHLEPAELGRMAKVCERLIAEIAAIYKGNLFFGENLMVIPLASPVPAVML